MFARDEVLVKTMPANFEWDIDLQASEWDWREATGFSDLELTVAPPSEDFWKRFEELPELDLDADLESLFDSELTSSVTGILRNHDCMWAGTCHNKEHKAQYSFPKPAAVPPPEPVIVVPPPPTPPAPKREPKKRGVIVQKTVGRSLLINSRTRQLPPRPETPPSLSESEEDKGVNIAEVTGQRVTPHQRMTNQIRRISNHVPATSIKFEHNYDKQVRTDDLGIQTPSDSEEEEEESADETMQEEEESEEEEEIDVVSLSRESLPTNPSRQARFELQQKMASAITTNSLLSASRAVSRRLNVKKPKRKRRTSDSEEDDDYPENYDVLIRKKWRSPKKSRFPNDYCTDSTEKRYLHNNMERMRRIELRNAFEDLRSLVPSLCTNNRAPKVTILKDANSYLEELRLKDKTLEMQVMELRNDQERLRMTLSKLRRSLAVARS